MNESSAVNGLQPFCCLPGILPNLVFFQPMMLPDLAVEMTISSKLTDDIEILLIREETIEIDDILIPQTIMNPNLLGNLMLDFFLSDDCFADYF